MNDQPTYEDLMRAWNNAIVCQDIGGSRAETMQELIALRERKTTWLGKEENDLRCALDAYLRDRGYTPTFRPSLAGIHDCDCNTLPHKRGCAILAK